jgi:caa(3)-type oxidase subunit IV
VNEHAHPHPNYVGIFVLLAVALALSIGLGLLAPSPLVITLIFGIAALKAYMVLAYYVHLSFEPKFVKVFVTCVFVLLAILWMGLVPDIVFVHGDLCASP